MKVERFSPHPETEPRHWVRHDQAFGSDRDHLRPVAAAGKDDSSTLADALDNKVRLLRPGGARQQGRRDVPPAHG